MDLEISIFSGNVLSFGHRLLKMLSQKDFLMTIYNFIALDTKLKSTFPVPQILKKYPMVVVICLAKRDIRNATMYAYEDVIQMTEITSHSVNTRVLSDALLIFTGASVSVGKNEASAVS